MEIDDTTTHVRKIVVELTADEVRAALLGYVALNMGIRQHDWVIRCENLHPLTIEMTMDMRPNATRSR